MGASKHDDEATKEKFASADELKEVLPEGTPDVILNGLSITINAIAIGFIIFIGVIFLKKTMMHQVQLKQIIRFDDRIIGISLTGGLVISEILSKEVVDIAFKPSHSAWGGFFSHTQVPIKFSTASTNLINGTKIGNPDPE